MPAKSQSQQKFFSVIHALKKGALKLSDLPKPAAQKVKKAAASMSDKTAKEFAKTKTKGLPKHVKESDGSYHREYVNGIAKDVQEGKTKLKELPEDLALVVKKVLKTKESSVTENELIFSSLSFMQYLMLEAEIVNILSSELTEDQIMALDKVISENMGVEYEEPSMEDEMDLDNMGEELPSDDVEEIPDEQPETAPWSNKLWKEYHSPAVSEIKAKFQAGDMTEIDALKKLQDHFKSTKTHEQPQIFDLQSLLHADSEEEEVSCAKGMLKKTMSESYGTATNKGNRSQNKKSNSKRKEK